MMGIIDEIQMKLKEIEEQEHVQYSTQWNPGAAHGDLLHRTAIMMSGSYT